MDNLSQAVRTRAFHISYALIRLSRSTPGVFSSYFESYAIDLLDRVVSRDFPASRPILESIDYFLKLAVEGEKVKAKEPAVQVKPVEKVEVATEKEEAVK